MAYTWDQANANAPSRPRRSISRCSATARFTTTDGSPPRRPSSLPWELGTATPPDVITGYKWELYNIAEDLTEYNDLAAKMPDKLKQMQDLLRRGEEIQRVAAGQLGPSRDS